MRSDLFSGRCGMKVALLLLLFPYTVKAQTANSDRPLTDAEKMTDAMRAGPKFSSLPRMRRFLIGRQKPAVNIVS
jgi:hypothetical protein